MDLRGEEVSEGTSLWREVIEAHEASLAAQRRFVTLCHDPVPIFERALADPRERGLALTFLKQQPDYVRLKLLEPLLVLALVGHREIGLVREVLLGMPRDTVRAAIARRQDEMLRDAGEEEYRRLLELLEHLDVNACRTLAERVISHADEDIREAGEDFMQRTSSGHSS